IIDLNDDGALDIVTDCCVLAGFNEARFDTVRVYSNPAFGTGSEKFAADLDGDGNVDLLLGGTQLWFVPGAGDGTFGTPRRAASRGSGGLLLRDFDGDGKLDLLVQESSTAGVRLFLLDGNGDGTFRPERLVAEGSFSTRYSVADFNRDGAPDLAYSINGVIF